MAKFDTSQNQNPVTGWCEIVNIWLRPRDMPQVYFCKKIRAQSGESGEIYNISIFFICRPFFSVSPTSYTRWQMFACCSSKTWNHSRKCLLGVRTLKLISILYIIAKTVEILAKTGLSFFDWTLNNGVVQE